MEDRNVNPQLLRKILDQAEEWMGIGEGIPLVLAIARAHSMTIGQEKSSPELKLLLHFLSVEDLLSSNVLLIQKLRNEPEVKAELQKLLH